MPDPTQPKRRGRPPGSPNKPKTVIPRNLELLRPSVTEGSVTGYVGELIGPEPIRVVLNWKGRAFGDAGGTEEVEWPQGWRIPQAGDAIFRDKNWGGMVQSVEFWTTDRKIVIRLI